MIRCSECGEVIGVYEPAIVGVNGDARETSVAASGRHAFEAAECYHHACYLGQTGTSQATGRSAGHSMHAGSALG